MTTHVVNEGRIRATGKTHRVFEVGAGTELRDWDSTHARRDCTPRARIMESRRIDRVVRRVAGVTGLRNYLHVRPP